ncbi:hypothetical protein BKA66DRAFT_589500 [Pyrenochaeta sp. MPI-SDFR-AT-0127]|nr:hypothetical protein BKA66DRAFT_589500 [Pyrenochaeta sp. MPI-SDFR-AT-0127]
MIPSTIIDKVLVQAQESATHSWEYGAVCEALFEYHNPELSAFHHSFPADQILTLSVEDISALKYARSFIHTYSTTLCDGNGSSADPVSLGISALLLSKNEPRYLRAAARQLQHLLHNVPRYTNGAISHRKASPSLWADYVYMVPPFLAYYVVFNDDVVLVQEAVRQRELYCDVLSTAKGPWKHIVNADGCNSNAKSDSELWSTSNGWAVAGMARVLATIRQSRFSDETKNERAVLVHMIRQILNGAMAFDTDKSGLVRNYIDDGAWFGEAGTFGKTYTEWAMQKRDVITLCIDHNVGIVKPVVNPLNERQRTPLKSISPEGQAFVVLLYAPWRDWKSVTKANDAS